MVLLLLLLLTLQPWVGLGLFHNSIPRLSILHLLPPISNLHLDVMVNKPYYKGKCNQSVSSSDQPLP
jgi:hypothetical protein